MKVKIFTVLMLAVALFIIDLIYPLLDLSAENPSRQEFASGYGFEANELQLLMSAYVGPQGDLTDYRVSPARAARFDGLPPTYIIAAGFDPLRDEAIAYGKSLTQAGVRTIVRIWPGQIHGFCSLSRSIPEGQIALFEAGRALCALKKRSI